MFKINNTNRIFPLVCVLIVMSGLFAYFYTRPNRTNNVIQMPNILTPTPTSIPISQSNKKSWPSPDGKKILVMKTLKSTQDMTTYSFSITTNATMSGQTIFSKTLDATSTINIPFNSWSPDNQYFFLQEHTGAETNTIVLKASGQAFSDGQVSHDVNMLFAQKNSGFILEEVTGWAAPTLLIVNSKTMDTIKVGPSFWFDISRNTLIRLSTSFQ